MKRSALEMALLPTPQDGPRVSLVRGDVTSPGMVSTEPGDVVGSPIDGPAVSGSGAVLTIDGHRLFIPYGAVTAPEVVEQVQQLAGIATGTQDAVSETHTTAVDAAEQAEVANAAVDAAMVELAAAQDAVEAANTAATAALAGADAAVEVANLAEAAAQGIVKVERFDPGHYPGRIWYQTNASGQGIGVKVSKSGSWVPYMLVADQVLVPSSIGSVLIGDGAITAPKLHVDALNFKTATGLTMTAGTITGATVTGGTVRTAMPGNARIHIDNDSGGRILFATAKDAVGMELRSPTGDEPSIVMREYTGTATTGAARIALRPSDGITFYNESGARQGGISGWGSILDMSTPAGGSIYIGNAASSLVSIRGGTTEVGAHAGGTLYLRALTGEIELASLGSGSWKVRRLSTATTISTLQFTAGRTGMVQTTQPANLHQATDGTIYVSTSSARAKVDVQDVTSDPERILGVPVRDWYDRAEADEYAAYLDGADDINPGGPWRRIPGVVAEEVEAAGLSQFVTYGTDGTPDGVMYDRLPLLLIPIVRDLRDRLETLEAHHV